MNLTDQVASAKFVSERRIPAPVLTPIHEHAMSASLATEPQHVRAAPSHADPYPYYGRLAREQAFFRDNTNGWWVAASAAAVREVLNSELCLTRPLSELVPSPLAGGPVAEIFGRLVRLRDDPGRAPLKDAVAGALRGLDLRHVAELAKARARELDIEIGEPLNAAKTTQFMFALPVQVIAQLLGIPRERYADVMGWLGDYGAATAAAATGIPAPSAALFEKGHRGAQALLDLGFEIAHDDARCGPLLAALMREAGRVGCNDEKDIIANAIGYMIQGFGAMAGMIGLVLLALARRPALLAKVDADRKLIRPLVQEVARFDPGTNSTFRFMARDGEIGGHRLREGDMIIVLLAAANRDPALNPDPDRFDVGRTDRKYLEFGAGRHACPADKLAPLIVEIAVDHLLTRGAPLETLEGALSYAASGHIRTPLFNR
jgi:cytochrome P450